MAVCANCGTEVASGANFCQACGHSLRTREVGWNYRISPDGKRLAWLGDYKEKSAILYQRLDEDDVGVIRLRGPLDEFWWAEDSRHILFSWDEYGDENYHLILADSEHPEAPHVDLTPHPGVLVLFHQQFPSDPAPCDRACNPMDAWTSRCANSRYNLASPNEVRAFRNWRQYYYTASSCSRPYGRCTVDRAASALPGKR